jgi:hypothetical protein
MNIVLVRAEQRGKMFENGIFETVHLKIVDILKNGVT